MIDKELYKMYEYGDTEENSKHKKHKELCLKLNELYVSKNKEYGDSFGKAFEEIGLTSAVTQMYHKMQRIITIHDKENLKYESLEDNLIDLANYALMTLIELKNETKLKCNKGVTYEYDSE